MSEQMNANPQNNEKVGIGAYIALLFACVFLSGVCATTAHWWGIFDFTTLNGHIGKVVSNVALNGETLKVVTSNFRGVGGNGAIDGFMFALTLIPTIMFAVGSITVLEHYGALRAAQQLLTPILRPIMGVPGTCALSMIAALQAADAGAALCRELKDQGKISEHESDIVAMWQLSANGMITNFFSSGAALFAITNADGSVAITTSIGMCLVVMLFFKFFGANIVRFVGLSKAKAK